MGLKLNWITKAGYIVYSGDDVSISRENYGENKRKTISFIFRNGADTKISKTGYIKVAMYDNTFQLRLYFSGAIANEGYKYSRSGNNNKRVLIYDKKLYDWLEGKEGNYGLNWDEKEGLYYIILKRRREE